MTEINLEEILPGPAADPALADLESALADGPPGLDLVQEAEAIAVEDVALGDLADELARRKMRLDYRKQRLADAASRAGHANIKTENGLQVLYRQRTVYYLPPDKAATLDWLQGSGLGGIIKTEPVIHHQTLQSTLKEFADRGGVIPPDLFQTKDDWAVTLRGKEAAVRRLSQ